MVKCSFFNKCGSFQSRLSYNSDTVLSQEDPDLLPLPPFPLPSTFQKTLVSHLLLSELVPAGDCHADPALSKPLPWVSPVASCLTYQVSDLFSIILGVILPDMVWASSPLVLLALFCTPPA